MKHKLQALLKSIPVSKPYFKKRNNQGAKRKRTLNIFIFSLLAYFVKPSFALIAAFFGAGLLNAGLTGWCGLARIIAKMPWNK